MGNRERVDYTLSPVALDAIKEIVCYSDKAGFPKISRPSHAVDLAVIEFCAQIKRSRVEPNFPFLTRENWK
jgi:hypothetical protein